MMSDAGNGGSRHASRRARQREALGELARLATDAPGLRGRLSAEHADVDRRTQRDLDKSATLLADRYGAARTQVAERRAADLKQADHDHVAAAKRHERHVAKALRKIDDGYRAATARLDRDVKDATLFVETSHESDVNRADGSFAETRKRIDAAKQSADEAVGDTRELAERYGRSMPEPPTGVEATASAEAHRDEAAAALDALRRRRLPPFVVGASPWVLWVIGIAVAALAGHVWAVREAVGPEAFDVNAVLRTPPDWGTVGLVAGAVAAVLLGLGVLLRRRSNAAVDRHVRAAAEARARLDAAADAELSEAAAARDEALAKAEATYAKEKEQLDAKYGPKLARHKKNEAEARRRHDADAEAGADKVAADHAANVAAVNRKWDDKLAEIDAAEEGDLRPVRERRDAALGESRRKLDEGLARVESDWARALSLTREVAGDADRPEFAAVGDWASWEPPTRFAPTVRLGELRVDLGELAGEGADLGGNMELPDAYAVPALLAFPDEANLLLEHEPDGRAAAIETLRLSMLRLLTGLPPGRVQFTLIDPVGLGRSFAAFMHLADHDDALVGGRVWTEADQIEQRLADLTGHMETVLQTYLRNEFDTIDAYNAQAGELAEPYRFLVVADLPTGFTETALQRLASIATSGPRCGVHVLVARDLRQSPAGGEAALEDIARACDVLRYDAATDRFDWQDEVFGRFDLTLDAPPAEDRLTDVLHVIGRAAKEAKRVEVPFGQITPDDAELWSDDSARTLGVPVGRTGATRRHRFELGKGVAQHALVAGKTGSGKSTLLNALITNLALWYGPDQLEMYLIDFKRGVEFKPYATLSVPHCRAIAVESDREFGLSVLRRLDEELGRRGDLFRGAGVQDVAGFREARPGEAMPRVMLIVDEFQELFSEDDKLAQDSALLIDRLVRQGRAFGIHVVLGSQTIGGTAGLSRATLGQVAVRVALQCSEADSQLILGDNNPAARLLTRPGEAIYNDAGGAVEHNQPFQVAWLPDDERERQLERVAAKAAGGSYPKPVVFEGSRPASMLDNDELRDGSDRKGVLYLGEPVAIKEPTHAELRRQAGANVLVVGQAEEAAAATVAAMVLSAAKTAKSPAVIRVLDGTPSDDENAGLMRDVAAAAKRLGGDVEVVGPRAVPDVMADLADELAGRLDGSRPEASPVVVFIHGLQRLRDLRKTDDDSFGGGGGFGSILGDEAEPAAPAKTPDKVLAELLRDGPPVGMHVVASVDTLTSLERRLSRESVREFDRRVLFQMSANDSSVLIDSPVANRLGFHRAVVASEEQGTLEKFRPYAIPDATTLERLGRPDAAGSA